MSCAPQHLQNGRPVFASIRRMTASVKSAVRGDGKKDIVGAGQDEKSFGCVSEWQQHYDAE